eukprot:gnl/MRDRNA2_/MRDRNA2_161507_c0_seq1.p1 gnl/MRDRNA2_/MRDRNA2_161507_c0~~gnl/MRDRNA2_/MRDRNA2_161507_c0_seq1.p1  ORF type:complete len:123 (-),score=24.92 gnl/MRDRNA2_/MRDRNA2_161507_c0_seq1:63-431(-)
MGKTFWDSKAAPLRYKRAYNDRSKTVCRESFHNDTNGTVVVWWYHARKVEATEWGKFSERKVAAGTKTEPEKMPTEFLHEVCVKYVTGQEARAVCLETTTAATGEAQILYSVSDIIKNSPFC